MNWDNFDWDQLPADAGQTVSVEYSCDWESSTIYRKSHDKSDRTVAVEQATITGGEYEPQNGILPEHGEWLPADADEALAIAGLVCGRNVEEDSSGGQGHCWRLVRGDEMPASIREEIEAEMIDGGVDSTDDYMASNGCHYRW
jgi:hypothetical protein